MKVTCLSVFLLATSATAYRQGVKGLLGDRKLKTGDKDMGMEDVISKGKKGGMNEAMKGKKGTGKAGKGKKGGMSKAVKGKGKGKGKGTKDDKAKEVMGMKGKGATESGCQSMMIKASYAEIEAGFSETAVGETMTFPVYDYNTDMQIGTYTDQTTFIFVGGEFADCTFSGSFNFDFDESIEYPFVSQVMVAGTCLGASNSITGGTGRYAGASGSEIFIDGGDAFFASELSICNSCA